MQFSETLKNYLLILLNYKILIINVICKYTKIYPMKRIISLQRRKFSFIFLLSDE